MKSLPLETMVSESLMKLVAVIVSLANPNSKQKQHSKTRRTDMFVFRTSPMTYSMLLFMRMKSTDARSK